MEEEGHSVQGTVTQDLNDDDWKKHLITLNLVAVPLQNSVLAGVYPASPSSWLIVVIVMMSSLYTHIDLSLGMIDAVKENLPHRSETCSIHWYFLFSVALLCWLWSLDRNKQISRIKMKLFCLILLLTKAVLCLFWAATICQCRPEQSWVPSCLPRACGSSSSTS